MEFKQLWGRRLGWMWIIINCLILLLIICQVANPEARSHPVAMTAIVISLLGLAWTGCAFLQNQNWARWVLLLAATFLWLVAVVGFVKFAPRFPWSWQFWLSLANAVLCNLLFLWLGWRAICFVYALPQPASSDNQYTLHLVLTTLLAALMLMAAAANHIEAVKDHAWWASGPGFYAQITQGGLRFYGFYGWGAWHVALFASSAVLLLGLLISLSRANIGIAVIRTASYLICGLFALSGVLFVHVILTEGNTLVGVPMTWSFKTTVLGLIVWLCATLALLSYWLGDAFRRLLLDT
jgi:hypothetical protein